MGSRYLLLVQTILTLLLPCWCYGPVSQGSITLPPAPSDNENLRFLSTSPDYGLVHSAPTASSEINRWWLGSKSPFSYEPCSTGNCQTSVVLNVPSSQSSSKTPINEITSSLYEDNPFLSGIFGSKKLSTFSSLPSISPTGFPTSSVDYGRPNIVQLSSDSISKFSGSNFWFSCIAIAHFSVGLAAPTAITSYNGPSNQNATPYPGCAAALKCVSETLCTVDGFMSDSPVVLTKDLLLLRVPLTVSIFSQYSVPVCTASLYILNDVIQYLKYWFGKSLLCNQ